MCELFAMSARHPADVRFSLTEFSRHGGLAGPHKDGWGIAWYEGEDVRLIKEPSAASDSACLGFIQEHPFRGTLVMSHIRKATQGALTLANSQPFTRELGGRSAMAKLSRCAAAASSLQEQTLMTELPSFTITLKQEQGFDFRVKFDWPDNADLLLDEPEPLGKRHGPNAARLVAAAVGNCLAASLAFCLRTKFKQDPGPLRASVTGQLARNERGRVRIGGLSVRIELAEDAGALQHLERCMAQFEDFCVVTESIRHGIPVSVEVVDAAGRAVH